MRTTSLELSKKIFEAFPEWKDTFNYWEWSDGMPVGEPYLTQPELMRRYGLWGTQELKGTCPAYDTDFLLDKLPKFVGDDKVPHLLCLQPNPVGKGWMAFYRHKSISPSHRLVETSHVAEASTPAEALGNLALALKEKGLL